MITYEFMELTPQAATSHWGWTIAFFLWFVGLAGMSLTMNLWLRSRRIHLIATAAAIVGTLLVVSHLGRMLNLPFAAINALLSWSFNFTSWMFIGICILAVLCVVTVIQSWGIWQAGKAGTPLGESWAESKCLLMFDAVLGVAATAYSGFLLTQAVGVPFWTSGALPVLWIFSGLACAMGLAEVMGAAGKLEGGSRPWFPQAANIIHLGEAFVLFSFVHVAFQGSPGAAAAAQNLLSGSASALFWAGAVGHGLVVPMVLSFTHGKGAVIAGGVCAILGALALRASVLFAGTFDPIIF